MLKEGAEDVKQNAGAAKELYLRAIDGGHVEAMCNLAIMLADGAEGVKRNAKEAVDLFRLAIANWSVEAIGNLAFVLKNGSEDVERNVKEAVKLYREAIEREDVDAMYDLGRYWRADRVTLSGMWKRRCGCTAEPLMARARMRCIILHFCCRTGRKELNRM